MLTLKSTVTRATECTDVIKAADQTINLKDKQIDAQDKLIGKQNDMNQMLNDRVVELESSNNSIFKNPFLYLALGLVGGFLVAK